MFRINSIELENFGSFRGIHKWVFPESTGAYFLTGRNEVEPELDRNGTGKSTLLNALTWCLYDRTLKRTRSSNIVNRYVGDNKCGVIVDLLVHNKELRIVRRQLPHRSLTCNGDTLDNTTLVGHLGLGFEAFCYSVILPQGKDMFFDLGPSDKLNLFSAIMGLEKWVERSEKAAEKARGLEVGIKVHEQEQATINGKIQALLSSISSLNSRAAEWENTHAARILEQQNKIANLEGEIASVQEPIPRLDKQIAEHEQVIKTWETKQKEHQPEAQVIYDNLTEIGEELLVHEVEIRQLERAIRDLQGVGKSCPLCRQEVDDITKERHVLQLKGELVLVTEKKDAAKVAETEFRDLQKELYAVINAEQTKFSNAMSLQHEVKGRKQYLEMRISTLNNNIKSELDRLRRLEDETNQFDALLIQQSQEVDGLKRDLESVSDRLVALQAQHASVSYWVAGFKRVRLYIIETTLRALEIEINNNLSNLGMPDWHIELDIERETKKGTISKGFTILIHEPQCDAPIEWESFSGGEAQILRLAGALGLANLIMERAGLEACQELYDEPSTHLSAGVINNLMGVLHQRALNADKQIWVIDHHSIEFGEFAGTVTVVKDEGGSRLE